MKINDVYRWKYKSTDGKLEPYWCKSQIGVVKENAHGLYMEDTYSTTNNATFTVEYVNENIDLTYLGNLDEFELKNKYDVVYYSPDDIMDLTHRNSYGHKIYVRKGAKKCLEKMKMVVQHHMEYYKYQAESALREIERLEQSVKSLSDNSYIPINDTVLSNMGLLSKGN